jgi:hypothetical protein
MIQIDGKIVFIEADRIKVVPFADTQDELSTGVEISFLDLFRVLRGFSELIENRPYASAIIKQAMNWVDELKDEVRSDYSARAKGPAAS